MKVEARNTWHRRVGSKESGFRYVDKRGRSITATRILARVQSLAIPPAWTDVRIAPRPGSHIQVVGTDKDGRRQYIYHPEFVAHRERRKYDKLTEFARLLPSLRRRIAQDVRRGDLSLSHVVAVILRLVSKLYFRLGSERSVKTYSTFGVTTLRSEHVHIGPRGSIRFDYVGKHHIRHVREVVDATIAPVLSKLKGLPGKRLFKFLHEDGVPQPVGPHHVNAYLKEVTGAHVTSKDFRTWGATLTAAMELAKMGAVRGIKALKKNIVEAARRVAERLGNTPAVCRKAYIHPRVLDFYSKGRTLLNYLGRRPTSQLSKSESALVQMLGDRHR